MRNFYEIEEGYYLNIKAYVEEWTNKLNVLSPEGAFDKIKLQRLGSFSQNLWKNFNADRNEANPLIKDKHYMESNLHAYCASFLFPNIERVFSLLVKDENSLALKNILFLEREELILADFGSGPLSATVGFICAIEYILKTNPELFPPKKITIYAVERSEKIYQFGLELLQKSLLNKDLFKIERFTSVEKIPTNIDIALCANIFNEIPEKHRKAPLVQLHSRLNWNGCVLILEPGQETHAKALGKLRDDFISTTEDCEIISPCTHKNLCPLSSSSPRSDWCWFRIGWNPPELFKEIEKYSKIDHHFLNFSYLFFVKSKVRIKDQFYARIVSDVLNVDFHKKTVVDYFKNNIIHGDKEEFLSSTENANLLKILLCTDDGSLKSALFNEADGEEFKRGMRFARKNSLKFIFNERNG